MHFKATFFIITPICLCREIGGYVKIWGGFVVVTLFGTKIIKTDNLTPRRRLILMPNCPLLTLGAKLSGVQFCLSVCLCLSGCL